MVSSSVLSDPSGVTILGEASMGASWAIASRPMQAGESADLVVAGSGATLLIFDSTISSPFITLTARQSGGEIVRILPKGFIFDLELLGDRLYVAAGRAGVLVYDTTTWLEIPSEHLALPATVPPDFYEEACELEVLDLGAGRHVVAVGTCRSGSTGRTLVYDTSLTTNWKLLKQFEEGGEVQALLLSEDFYSDAAKTVVSLIAVPACGSMRLHHFQFTPSNPALVWLSASETTQNVATGFVRDLVLHNTPNQPLRLYAAAHHQGVRAYTLSLGGSPAAFLATELVGSGWPLTEPTAFWYPTSLDFDPQYQRLAVGAMAHFKDEMQFSPGCSLPTACTLFEPIRILGTMVAQPELVVYDVSSMSAGPVLIQRANNDSAFGDHELWGMSVRFRTSTANRIVVDVGSHNRGIGAILFEQGGLTWTVASGWFDREDDLALYTNDDLLVLDNVLYVSTEKDLRGFDLNTTGDPLDIVPSLSVGVNSKEKEGPVGIGGFGNPQARVLGLASDGIDIFDVHKDLINDYSVHPQESTSNKAIGGVARLAVGLQGLSQPSWQQAYRWLVVPLLTDDYVPTLLSTASPVKQGSVQFWSVADATQANHLLTSTGSKFFWPTAFGDDLQQNTSDDQVLRFYGAEVRVLNAQQAVVYCTVMRGLNGQSTPGLVRFLVEPDALHAGKLLFSNAVFVPLLNAPTVQEGFYQVWKLHFDPEGSMLYAAFACGGIAVFQDLTPSTMTPPILVGERHDLPDSAFDILRGPGQSLYVSMLNAGIGLVSDRNAVAAHPVQIYPTRFQALGLALDPFAADRRRLYVADTQGGVLHLQVNWEAFQ